MGMSALAPWVSPRDFFNLVGNRLPGALRFPKGHAKAGQVLSWNAGRARRGELVVAAAQYRGQNCVAACAPNFGRGAALASTVD